MEQFEKAVSLNEITKGAWECLREVRNKDGPMEFCFTALGSGKALRDELLAGRYHERKGNRVIITRPKPRVATAPWFRDRVWQRSMCNNGVYEDLVGGSPWESMACQKDKGTDIAIRATIHILQELHLKAPGKPVWGRHLDVRKFFPSTPQHLIKRLDRERIREPRFLPYLEEIIDHHADERTPEEIAADPHGKRGTGLGSQINQLHQVALLDEIDREILPTVHGYLRFNDDFLLLDHDPTKVDAAAGRIRERLAEMGLEMTDKAGRFRADRGFSFLRKRFLLKPSGKIVLRLHREALAEERHILKSLKKKLDAGERSYSQIKAHYQSWVANASYAGMGPIRAMDKAYKEIFGRAPEYKLKRRHLYGDYRQGKAAHPGAGAGEPPAQGRAGAESGGSGLRRGDGGRGSAEPGGRR